MLAYASGAREAKTLEALAHNWREYRFLWDKYIYSHSDQEVALFKANYPQTVLGTEALPHFGGNRPEDTKNVVSWDETCVLMESDDRVWMTPRSWHCKNELMARARAIGDAKNLEELREFLIAFDQSKLEVAEVYQAHTGWLKEQEWYKAADQVARSGFDPSSPDWWLKDRRKDLRQVDWSLAWWREDLPSQALVAGYDETRILVRTAAGTLKILPIPRRPSFVMRVIRRFWRRSRNAFPSLL